MSRDGERFSGGEAGDIAELVFQDARGDLGQRIDRSEARGARNGISVEHRHRRDFSLFGQNGKNGLTGVVDLNRGAGAYPSLER